MAWTAWSDNTGSDIQYDGVYSIDVEEVEEDEEEDFDDFKDEEEDEEEYPETSERIITFEKMTYLVLALLIF